MTSWSVKVTGLRETMNALEAVDKAAANAIYRQIRSGAQQIATAASYIAPGHNPLSNWGTFFQRGRDLSYDPSAVSAGFKPRKNNYRRRGVSAGLGYDVFQTNAAGNIFEVIGSGSRVTTASGANLSQTVASRFGRKSPRTLIKAYYSVDVPALQDEINQSIIDAARKAGLI